MPAPTFSRHSRPLSPPTTSSIATSSRNKHIHVMSPATTSTSYSPTITSGGQQQKVNVVTRVAIEGKAKQGQDGVAIKMYLKISLPLDNVSPGTTIPLFPEENVKILTSQVHPLDNHSVPYNFSSTLSPLLHNAARALNLPARSQETFDAAFNISAPPGSSSVRASKSSIGSSSKGSENIPPIDGQYTGHILVSGYSISYVLPKIFPSRGKGQLSDTEGESLSRSAYRSRRPSIGERNNAQFMAAIDMWIPYVSRPPRSPYLLSIPIPRCLHNNIKLRIFPPTPVSTSFASLSSVEEDGGTWDLTSDPHVTRTTSSRPSRSNSYTHFADDESSDSSTAGFSDGCGIQGTFPSAERIRVRWAKPLKNIEVPGSGGDGRRRVGVKEAKGEMTCVVRGKSKAKERNGVEGLLMDIEYKGTCRGVWFPGVATLLGMDVGLETKGSDVYWLEGSPSEWDVVGGVGYTGFDVGDFPKLPGPDSRTASQGSVTPQILISSSPQGGRSAQASRTNSTSSTSSLLRAPLPAQNVAEYSFEGSNATLASSESSPLGTMSSMSSFMPGSTNPAGKSPGVPITLHVNMNEIVGPAKNVFTFTISGTVLVVPRPTAQSSYSSPIDSGSENNADTDPEPIVLPRFTVLAADSESTTTIVRNEIDSMPATIEVYNSSGDIYRDAQAKKTVLQKGGFTKCSEVGARIVLKSIGMVNGNVKSLQPPSRPRTPTGNLPRVPSNSSLARMLFPPRPKRDGPLMIPFVTVALTPLMQESDLLPYGYAVRVCLNAPADSDSDWLEFGLAHPGPGSSKGETKPPKLVITSASVEGVPVRFETTAAAKLEASGLSFEEMTGKEWLSWVKVHVGAIGGGAVVIDYIAGDRKSDRAKEKTKRKDEQVLDLLLPTFSIPVGRLEVDIEGLSGMKIALQSNFTHHQPSSNGHRLLHHSMEEFFYPHVSLTARPSPKSRESWIWIKPLLFITWALFLVGFLYMHRLGQEMKQMRQVLEGYSVAAASGWNDTPEPVTVTAMLYSSTGPRWWFAEAPTETEPSPSEQITPTPTTPIPTTAKAPELASSSTPSVTEIEVVASTPVISSTGSETQALIPFQQIISLYWPVQDLRATIDKFMQTAEKVWQMFRKVYHYPLDPT